MKAVNLTPYELACAISRFYFSEGKGNGDLSQLETEEITRQMLAAPDLLAAAELVIRRYGAAHALDKPWDVPELSEVIAACQAAIAKALGNPPTPEGI